MSKPAADTPLISVVMPCHNAGPYLEEAVCSALDQEAVRTELVLVDDGSTDGSRAIAEKLVTRYPGRLTLLHSERLGPYPARNRALKHARGELIAFLDADDWWEPDALAKLQSALLTSDADIAYCGWQNVGAGITSAPYVPPAYEAEDAAAHFVRTCPWPIHAALVRRRVVDALGGFSEQRYSSMDYHFWLRAYGHTQRIVRVPEVLAYYRWHGSGQVSAVKWRQVLDALWAQKDFIARHPDLVAHIDPSRMIDLTEGRVLREAYKAFWKRDLASAHQLFRHSLANQTFTRKDFSHAILTIAPFEIYRKLIELSDKIKGAVKK